MVRRHLPHRAVGEEGLDLPHEGEGEVSGAAAGVTDQIAAIAYEPSQAFSLLVREHEILVSGHVEDRHLARAVGEAGELELDAAIADAKLLVGPLEQIVDVRLVAPPVEIAEAATVGGRLPDRLPVLDLANQCRRRRGALLLRPAKRRDRQGQRRHGFAGLPSLRLRWRRRLPVATDFLAKRGQPNHREGHHHRTPDRALRSARQKHRQTLLNQDGRRREGNSRRKTRHRKWYSFLVATLAQTVYDVKMGGRFFFS